MRCCPAGPCGSPRPPVPGHRPPPLPALGAARRCGCEMPGKSPGPALSAAPRAAPERAGQELPASGGCRHSQPRAAPRSAPSAAAFLCSPQPQTCRWLFRSRVPCLHPCLIYMLEKPVILDRSLDCEIVLPAKSNFRILFGVFCS